MHFDVRQVEPGRWTYDLYPDGGEPTEFAVEDATSRRDAEKKGRAKMRARIGLRPRKTKASLESTADLAKRLKGQLLTELRAKKR